VDFSHIVTAGDRISVYPVFEAMDITPLLRLRPAPLRVPRFIVDVNLGRLARYLRLLGFDCHYRNDIDDAEIARISAGESRTVLTRDRALLQQKIITRGYFVRADRPLEQVREVLARLDLYRQVRPFTRCTRCNGVLEAVDKGDVLDRLEPKTRRYYDEFRRCTACGQIYWKGSHFERAGRLVEAIRQRRRPGDGRGGRRPTVIDGRPARAPAGYYTSEMGDGVAKQDIQSAPRWEHFPHGADIGVRGYGATREQAFEQAALALSAVITDPGGIASAGTVTVTCEAPDDELLLVDWLNALIYEMATRKWLFGAFVVRISDRVLTGQARGEALEVARHRPAVEVKGATYTGLRVAREANGLWVAQCVVDV
jgi:hypothetical protein